MNESKQDKMPVIIYEVDGMSKWELAALVQGLHGEHTKVSKKADWSYLVDVGHGEIHDVKIVDSQLWMPTVLIGMDRIRCGAHSTLRFALEKHRKTFKIADGNMASDLFSEAKHSVSLEGVLEYIYAPRDKISPEKSKHLTIGNMSHRGFVLDLFDGSSYLVNTGRISCLDSNGGLTGGMGVTEHDAVRMLKDYGDLSVLKQNDKWMNAGLERKFLLEEVSTAKTLPIHSLESTSVLELRPPIARF